MIWYLLFVGHVLTTLHRPDKIKLPIGKWLLQSISNLERSLRQARAHRRHSQRKPRTQVSRDRKSKTNYQDRTAVIRTLSDNPCAAARAFPLSAWTGLNVMPQHCAPYLFARYLELPPIPQPTSTMVLGLFAASSGSASIRGSKLLVIADALYIKTLTAVIKLIL